ncbi:hypothetical protein IU427_32980 [Nocardia beijingensis]|uniref:hypothetical protein n=1 Tax=Nocardia beijingensis TaxID=95162 RepID=UPI001895AF50|nr:hypothetical protein [Nocardia beijingensis]MBF6469939.1 hypothetical protein [Nocardia beijingensis]
MVGTSAQSTRDYEVFRGELDRPRVIRPDAAAGPRARIQPGSNLGRKHGPVLLRWAAGPSVPETRGAIGRLGRAGHAAWPDSGHALSFAVLTSGDPIRYAEATLVAGSLDGSHRQTPRVAATDLAF